MTRLHEHAACILNHCSEFCRNCKTRGLSAEYYVGKLEDENADPATVLGELKDHVSELRQLQGGDLLDIAIVMEGSSISTSRFDLSKKVN